MLRFAEFGLCREACPFCGPSAFIRLNANELAVRCLRCGASPVHVSVGWVLRDLGSLQALDAYELSSRGPLVNWLKRQCASLELSEYFDGVEPGSHFNGVRCEDVQRLGFADASFDLVTHTEVFEHVPDDRSGFLELFRVLRPGGRMVFTVPMHGSAHTVERATQLASGIVHHLPMTYHGDRIRGKGRVLVYRDYGQDIETRLLEAGFSTARLLPPDPRVPSGYGRYVVLAAKN